MKTMLSYFIHRPIVAAALCLMFAVLGFAGR